MGITASQTSELARECEAKADQLLALQEAQRFGGSDEAALSQNESDLRAKVLALDSATVAAALAASDNAQNQLQKAITTVKTVTLGINDVKKAIQISADLIAVATGVLGGNPGSVFVAAAQLVTDVTASAS